MKITEAQYMILRQEKAIETALMHLRDTYGVLNIGQEAKLKQAYDLAYSIKNELKQQYEIIE